MATQTDQTLDRRRKAIAASYRKQGYQVTRASSPDRLPPFLRDCHPDLVAEKEDDRVVIEIKASNALKGANDLVQLADRVAAQPGWRLELVTVREEPSFADLLTSGWIDVMIRPPVAGTDMARECVYRTEVLACLLRAIAIANKLHVGDRSTAYIAEALVQRGVIGEDLLDRVEDARVWQDSFMRRLPLPRTADRQAAEVEKLCRDILAQAQNQEG